MRQLCLTVGVKLISKILTFNNAAHNQELKRQGFEPFAIKRKKDLSNPMIVDTSRLFILRTTDSESPNLLDLTKYLRENWPLVDVLVIAPKCSPKFVLDVINAGAKDIILNDSSDQVIKAVRKIIDNQIILPRIPSASSRRGNIFRFEGMISRSIQMWDIFETIKQVADSDASVLILGETGTGKELVARAIHRHSSCRGRFVAVNCSAVPQNLLDSELFGHVKGAFTGADRDKKGLFRFADHGSIFLDEIANMPMDAQYYLLRVLQENKIRPVGAHDEVDVNARVIAATSQPLEAYVRDNKFREDLLYRLDVIRIELPPLRERPEDIIFLFHHFSKKIAKSYQLTLPEFSDRFLDALVGYDWPGNVRQLQNIAERLVLTLSGQKLMAKHLTKALKLKKISTTNDSKNETFQIDPANLPPYEEAIKKSVEKYEEQYFLSLMKKHNGKMSEAAKQAGINRRTLLRKLNKYNIDKQKFRDEGNN